MNAKWSEEMANCVLKERPKLMNSWAYDNGVVLKGLFDLYKITGNRQYSKFCMDYINSQLIGKNIISGVDYKEYNLDLINNAKILLYLHSIIKENPYKTTAERFMTMLKNHPRTVEGAFFHKAIYPHQIWLDGLYMAAPFYAEYTKEFENGKNYDDVIRQFVISFKHTKDSRTGLLYHAWDESRSQFWCDAKTGLSKHFWGRAIGWYAMALCDVIEILPPKTNGINNLKSILSELLDAVCCFQDESGCWYQIVDLKEKKGNYLEASCSCMFLYAIVKAMSLKVIRGKRYELAARTAYNGIIDEFVLITDNGYINLNKTCRGAGLGNKDKRDGSYAYYISEPIICNDLKGVGAFILAMNEYEKFFSL